MTDGRTSDGATDRDGGLDRRRALVAAGLVLVAAVVAAYALGLLGAPAVTGADHRFGPVTAERTHVLTDLAVTNPNPVGVRLGGTTVNYTVSMNGVGMARGEREGVNLTAGTTTVRFNTTMTNERIPPWWVSHVRGGERTRVRVDATVRSSLLGGRSFEIEQNRTVETDIIGQFASEETRPVDGPPSPLYENPVLYVNETDAEWGEVTRAATPIRTTFVVYNPKTVPYTITEVGYRAEMNGVPVGNGTTDRPHVIEGRTTETIRARTVIDNDRLDEWWVTHLRRDQVTDLRIDFFARLELPTGRTVEIPLRGLTYERRIETDIFDNKADGGGEDDGNEAATPGGDSGTATAARTDPGTATPVPTPTPTPTPTDDGILDVRPVALAPG